MGGGEACLLEWRATGKGMGSGHVRLSARGVGGRLAVLGRKAGQAVDQLRGGG